MGTEPERIQTKKKGNGSKKDSGSKKKVKKKKNPAWKTEVTRLKNYSKNPKAPDESKEQSEKEERKKSDSKTPIKMEGNINKKTKQKAFVQPGYTNAKNAFYEVGNMPWPAAPMNYWSGSGWNQQAQRQFQPRWNFEYAQQAACK